MLSKPFTLLLISRQTLARVDLLSGAKPRILRHWHRTRFEGDSIATLVDATCRLGKPKPGKVIVLCDQFWMGVTALPDEIASGLAGEELLQAISLECEIYSGISAFDSRVSNIPLDQDGSGESRWLVTQVANADARSCAESVDQCGGTLVGMAHPAIPVLPQPNPGRLGKLGSSSSEPSWRSVQVWGTTVSLLRGNGNSLRDAVVQEGNLSQPRMAAAVQSFLDAADGQVAEEHGQDGPANGIAGEEVEPPAASVCWVNQAIPGVPGDRVMDTGKDGGLLTWATAWGRQLAAPADSTGLVRLPRRPMSRERSIALAALGGLATLLGCVAHDRYLGQEVETVEESNRLLSERKKQIAVEKKSADALERTLGASREKLFALTQDNANLRENITAAEELHRKQQARWTTLMDAVATSHQPNCWIRRMAATDQSVVIHGYAVDSAAALRLSSAVDRLVADTGWRVTPAETHPEDGKLVAFSFALSISAPTTRPGLASGNRMTSATGGTSPSGGATLQGAANTGAGTRAARRRAHRESTAGTPAATGG